MITKQRFFPLTLIALGCLLLAGVIGYILRHDRVVPANAFPVPPAIAGLIQTSHVAGQQAMEEFSSLHGQSFPLISGAWSDYGDAHQVTLWVAGPADSTAAAQMVTAMRDKIAEGNSPFHPLDERSDGGPTIYALTGMGQSHYYFQSHNWVVWLAANPEIAEQALAEVLAFYMNER